MAQKIIQNFEIDFVKEDIDQLLALGNHLNTSFYILEAVEERKMDDILNLIIEYFNKAKDKTKIVTLWNKVKTLSDPKVIILSYIFRFYSETQNLKTGKNLYVVVNDEDVVLYETIETDLSHCNEAKREKLLARKILQNAYLYAINSSQWLNLFKLKRDKLNIREAYYYNWLYYASQSPLWASRIRTFNGIVDNETQSVEFEEEDDLQAFYENYGYEPDEQQINVQNKCLEIEQNPDKTLTDFYEKYRGNGIFVVEEEYLDNMEKVVC
jgi:hypothetical protein